MDVPRSGHGLSIREQPVGDAKVIFSNHFLTGVGTFSTTTDFAGNYSIDLPTLGKNAYNAWVSHPDFDSRNVCTDQVLMTPRDERFLLGEGIQFSAVTGTFHGEDHYVTSLDLYVRLRGGGGP